TAAELKTQPTQHSVNEMLILGIQPDLLLCRSEHVLSDGAKKKLSLFCNIAYDNVIQALDASNIYEVPLAYHHEGFDEQVCQFFNLTPPAPDLSPWLTYQKALTQEPVLGIKVGIVGKYVALPDAYKSVIEAVDHAALSQGVRAQIVWIDSENPDDLHQMLPGLDAIIVPGGFGARGIEGKLKAIHYARKHNVPFLGICLGMQLAVIEFCRSVLGITTASSSEFEATDHAVVGLMTEWIADEVTHHRSQDSDMGGTMRLGAYPCMLNQDSKVYKAYGSEKISERHRHRYEVNMAYRRQMEEAGLQFVGISPDGKLPEIIELEGHPWFVAGQFHPEFKSRPFLPHPLFMGLINAAKGAKS
ncbi:MAG: CTP synthase, partial [Alphaproteobacteria bacterium]|nr:CTP synthase [Alphaproteobacteria bacterium]